MNPTHLTPVQVVADPMRRAILQSIWSRECSVNQLVAKFQVSQPAISFHLRHLRDGGYVQVRRQGTKRLYQARPEAFKSLKPFLESYWSDKLALLKDAAELEARHRRYKARTLAATKAVAQEGAL